NATDRASSPKGKPVIARPVRFAADRLTLEAVGTGRARYSVMLRSATPGKVMELALAADERFKKGDKLLQIDDAEQRVVVALAEARLDQAKTVLSRAERLAGAGTVTEARLDEARSAARVAQLELERQRVLLADKKLLAPFDGVSGIPNIEAGAWVDTDDEIATFDDRSEIEVEFDLPETLLSRVSRGMSVIATTPAAPGRVFTGRVTAIGSRVGIENRTAKVRVALPNPDDVLRPGSSFVIKLDLQGRRYPSVPELAVQFSRGALYVWRVNNGKAERVDVEMVRRREGDVLVDGPLNAYDLVIIEGTQRLREGRALDVRGLQPGEAS
ncbi:MAG: efflux RND transporter periplasmic adaptor subunit, partial [Pseudomonadota bacterium]